MQHYKKGDRVQFVAKRYHPDDKGREIGRYPGTLIEWHESMGEGLFKPDDWDDLANGLAEEGTLSWTDVRELVEGGEIDVTGTDIVFLERPTPRYVVFGKISVPAGEDPYMYAVMHANEIEIEAVDSVEDGD